MSTLLDHAGPICFGLAMWMYALTGWIPKAWRFA